MNTKQIGDRTEAAVLSALLNVYPTVLLPFGDNQRFDMAFLDHDGSFFRVQCKTGRYQKGSINFNVVSMGTDRKAGERRTYQGEIDYFGVSCPDFNGIYLVPIADANGKSTCTMRVDPIGKTTSPNRVRWASDYLI